MQRDCKWKNGKISFRRRTVSVGLGGRQDYVRQGVGSRVHGTCRLAP